MKHHQTLRRGISVLLTLVMCLSLVPITALAEEGTETGVEINPTNFPDYVFREYVKNKIDTDGNGTLSAEEIAAVKKIEFINDAGKYLYTLSGIEHFTNLNTLWCINSKMSKLDVSKNTALKSLRCESNQLTTLDVSKNTALESLWCYDNNLTTLNLGENTVLKTLWCYDNQLTKLDVSNHQLTRLYANDNPKMETLNCSNNKLTDLEVSSDTVLTNLNCSNNKLTFLDLSQNGDLATLNCSNNRLTSLDLSSTKVSNLSAEGNTYVIPLTDSTFALSDLPGKFDVNRAGNWTGGSVSKTKLTVNADADQVTYDYACGQDRTVTFTLKKDDGSNGVIINKANFPDAVFREWISKVYDKDKDNMLSAEECASVEDLFLDGSGITNLKGIEYFPELGWLFCNNNQLTFVDVSKNEALERLRCENNPLKSLDVSKNTKLKSLTCANNQLTTLDVSKNTALESLCCSNSQLTTLDVSKNTALEDLECDSNNLTTLDVSKNTALEDLDCNDNPLKSLDVRNNAALEDLNCSGIDLTTLNVRNNTALKHLWCNSNHLTSLDVSENTALEGLYCDSNQLATLDVSYNKNLKSLYCNSNHLTSLDVSENAALESLYCNSNQLTSLDTIGTKVYDPRCDNNTYTIILVSETRTFDLSTLPGNFDVSRAGDWSDGAKVNGNILTVNEGIHEVTYTYDCGSTKGDKKSFTLNVVEQPTELTVTTQPDKTAYTHGDTFNPTGMVVKAAFEDGTTEENFTGYVVKYETDGKKYMVQGDTKVTLKAGNKEVEITGLTVGRKDVTITDVTAVSRDYESGNRTVKLSGGKVRGVISDDTVEADLTGAVGTIADEDVGTDKPVTVTGAALTGEDADNYRLIAQPDGVTVNIEKATYSGNLTVNKNVRINTAQTVDVNMFYKFGDIKGAEVTSAKEGIDIFKVISNVSLKDNIVTFDVDKEKYANRIATINLVISSTNYKDINATLTVRTVNKTDVPMDISGVPAEAKTYGDPEFTLTSTVTDAAINGSWTWESSDPTVLQVTGSGDKAAVKILKAGSATITAMYESDASIGQFTTTDITVNKATITVTGKNLIIPVNGTLPDRDNPVEGIHYTVSGLVGSDARTDTVYMYYQKNGVTVAPDVTHAGTYDIVIYGLTAPSDNYNKVVFEKGTLTIAYAITFDGNGGTLSGSQTVLAGKNDKLGSLPVPSRDGYTFDGWYTAQTGGEKVTVSTVYTENTTLYAHWTNNGGNGSSGNNGGNGSSGNNGGNGSITKPECTHGTTEIRGAVAATCIEKGYTGDTYCKDCGEKVATGQDIEALGHDKDYFRQGGCNLYYSW